MYQGAIMSLVQWCKSGVVSVIIWDWSYDWSSPDLIRLRYLKVWWSRGAGLGPTVSESAPILYLLWKGGMCRWPTVWSASSAPHTRLREHLEHLFAYVEGRAEVELPQAQLIHDLWVWEPDQPVANTYTPIITPVVLDNFNITPIDVDRNLLLSPSSSSYLDASRSYSHHQLRVNIYSLWDSWVFLCWLLCMGGVPPSKEVLISYNLICLNRPVDTAWTFSHITNTNLFREEARRRCSGPQVREEAGTSLCNPQIWL